MVAKYLLLHSSCTTRDATVPCPPSPTPAPCHPLSPPVCRAGLYDRDTSSFLSLFTTDSLRLCGAGFGSPTALTLNRRRLALSQRRLALNRRRLALNRRRLALSQRRSALNRRRLTLNRRRLALSQRRSALNRRRLTLNRRRLALSQRRSALNRRRLTLNRRRIRGRAHSPADQQHSHARETGHGAQCRRKVYPAPSMTAPPALSSTFDGMAAAKQGPGPVRPYPLCQCRRPPLPRHTRRPAPSPTASGTGLPGVRRVHVELHRGPGRRGGHTPARPLGRRARARRVPPPGPRGRAPPGRARLRRRGGGRAHGLVAAGAGGGAGHAAGRAAAALRRGGQVVAVEMDDDPGVRLEDKAADDGAHGAPPALHAHVDPGAVSAALGGGGGGGMGVGGRWA